MTNVSGSPIDSSSGHQDQAKAVLSQRTGKLAPGMTTRKLPWLDGNKSSTMSPVTVLPTPARGLHTPGSEMSRSSSKRSSRALEHKEELSTSSIRKPSRSSLKSNPTIRSSGSTPALRQMSARAVSERQVASLSAESLSPAIWGKLPLMPHKSRTQMLSSPLRGGALPKPGASPAERRPSILRRSVDHSYLPPTEETCEYLDVEPRRPSLVPVPAHLERDDESESVRRLVQRNAHISLPPRVVRLTRMSPRQPTPMHHSLAQIQERQINTAIEGLEEMVQEAVEVAEETADPDQVVEVYEIIEDATNAIRRASVAPVRHLMQTSEPLAVSEDDSQFFTTSESSSETYITRPNETFKREATTVNDDPAPIQILHSTIETSPKSSFLQVGAPDTVDWAYKKQDRDGYRQSSTSSSSASSKTRRRPSRYDNQNDLLLPPGPIQSAPRDHVDFVLRPSRPRSSSRGRSRRRKGSSSDKPKGRRGHIHRSSRSLDDGSPSRNSQHEASEYDTPFDEEEAVRVGSRVYAERRSRYRNELSMRDHMHHHTFTRRREHRRQPIARNWRTGKKRLTATIACINTALLGIIVGIYAGEVPRIQYMLADESHYVIVGNVVFYCGLAISTFISWPLPLLHGRKPYILASLALAMPLQFPQAIVVGWKRSPKNPTYRTGLLLARALTGLVLGFANVNFISILLDLFGASLQSKNPHQEIVIVNDVRRHGGGMGIWLGIWSFCWISSLAIGFQVGAGIIESLTPDWGFYITVFILIAALLLNILAPETRRSAYRRSVTEVYDRDEQFITRRVARGEVKLHLSTEGPKYWFEEVWAGMKLTTMMICQAGFSVLALYLGWIYAQIVLVIVLLGALLSRDYKWQPRYVGLGVMSIAFGALLAIPLTKAGLFSRERKKPFRTDSMTFERQVTWSSHLIRRCIFTLTLPLMGLAYTVSSAGRPKPWIVPILFAGAVGFLSILAIAECHGLIMETFDTCDLQPGVNTRHRLQSMAMQDKRRRTNYSSFPRISAGIFASQTIAFLLAAVATEVGGIMTRQLGAQTSTGVTAGILLFMTLLLAAVLTRYKQIQVIPNHTFGTRRDTKAWEEFKQMGKDDWKAVVIGNPSGKMRRMNVLELGGLSRWTEIRKLNFLIREERQHGGKNRYY